MTIFNQSKYLNYYDKAVIDHDNIKKDKFTQLLFNSYYFFFHEKKNNLVHKTNHLILGSNIFLNLLLAYKLAYLEIINNHNSNNISNTKNKKNIKTISVFFNKNMDFWNYNIPLTPIFKKMLLSKLKQFNLIYQNILSKPTINNLNSSELFNCLNNESNIFNLDNKQLIKCIIKDLEAINSLSQKPFINLINMNDLKIYNSFNVQNVCKKIGKKNEEYIYNNILRVAHQKEIDKLNYPKEYEYLKENIKRVNSYDYLFHDFENLTQKTETLKPLMMSNLTTTICPDYNILTYYLLVENMYITSSTDLHPWANIKITPTYKDQDIMNKNLYEFNEQQTQSMEIPNNIMDFNEKSSIQTYQDELVNEIKTLYFNPNEVESMPFDYLIKIANSDSNFNYYGSAKKIANNPLSFMSQPLLDLEKIFN
jgi:hypothetical protein